MDRKRTYEDVSTIAGSSADGGRVAASRRLRVIVIGGGFAGLRAARRLAKQDVEVVLIDKQNHHLFQPLLYQVATGALEPPDVGAPLRTIFRTAENVEVYMDEVLDIDFDQHSVHGESRTYVYDQLIVACGARPNLASVKPWQGRAVPLKCLEDAHEIRRRLFLAFEKAERCEDPATRDELLTFVIIGGGPTGVELAGSFADVTQHVLVRDFRHCDPAAARIILIEGDDRLLPTYPSTLSHSARQTLEAKGIEVITGHFAKPIDEATIAVGERKIQTRTVLWAAGVEPEPLLRRVFADELFNDEGRVMVAPDLSIPSRPEVWVVGDAAAVRHGDGWVPGLAASAIQEGEAVAKNIMRRAHGEEPAPFRYKARGMMSVLRRGQAVAQIGRFELAGVIAWLLWLIVHLVGLIGFRSRASVLASWVWAYVGNKRAGRILTSEARRRPLALQVPAPPEPARQPAEAGGEVKRSREAGGE